MVNSLSYLYKEFQACEVDIIHFEDSLSQINDNTEFVVFSDNKYWEMLFL